jgi:glucokinase
MKQDFQPYVAGVDLGGTYLRVAVIEPRSGRIIRVSKQKSASLNVHRFCDALVRSIRPHRARVSAFGIGVPGFCDKQQQRVVTTWSVLPFLENCELAAAVEQRFGVKVVVDNDARAHAVGEYRYGGWGKPRSLVVLTLGTGVGLAWYIDGVLYPPSNHGAMGGHMALAYQSGDPCYCGANGCLESFASGNALAAAANERLARFLPSRLELPVGAEDVCRAGGNDDLAHACILRAIESLRCALHNLHHLYFPDIVVLGGGLAQGLVPYLGNLRNWFRRLPRFDGRRNRLVVSRLGDKAGLLGAAALTFRDWNKPNSAGASS